MTSLLKKLPISIKVHVVKRRKLLELLEFLFSSLLLITNVVVVMFFTYIFGMDYYCFGDYALSVTVNIYMNIFYYRGMHFSAFARSWDRMSSVRLSVRL